MTGHVPLVHRDFVRLREIDVTRNYRKERGRETEHLVARAFAADGWPHAEAVGAGASGTDIKGLPGICVEVKARRGFDVQAAMRQAARNAGDNVPVTVVRPDGMGPASVDEWPMILPFGLGRRLLREAGYGEPLPPPVLDPYSLSSGNALSATLAPEQGPARGSGCPDDSSAPQRPPAADAWTMTGDV